MGPSPPIDGKCLLYGRRRQVHHEQSCRPYPVVYRLLGADLVSLVPFVLVYMGVDRSRRYSGLQSRHAASNVVKFEGAPNQSKLLEPGWHLAGEQLPTFTTARPSAVPGRKPAGLQD